MMSGGGFSMDSIPPGVKKTIQDIKEISRIHTEEEIYTMLQECSMDPNETVQKLLSQDTFHEVKRKRDRKKESISSREPADSRWKQGMQRRDVRSGRGTYSPRYIHDSGVTRNFNAGKENGISQVTEKGSTLASSLGSHATENDSGVPPSSYVPGVTNGPAKSAHVGSSLESGSQMPDGGGFPFGEESSIAEIKSENAVPPPVDSKTGPENVVGVMHGLPVQSSCQFPSPGTGMQASVSGVCASATDPVLVPSLETCASGVVGTIKREVPSERTAIEPAAAKPVSSVAADSEISSGEKAPSEMGSSSIQGKLLAKSQVVDVNNLSDATQPSSSSSQFGSSGGRPSPNLGSRIQQIIGPHKVGPSKEWKPKPTSQVPTHVSGTIGTSDVVSNTDDTLSPCGAPEDATSKLQKKMEELHFSDDQHVIIPNHLQVPESERTGLSFGSFDANFTLGTRFMNGPSNENCSMPLTDSSQAPEENIEEPTLSIQNASTAQEEDFADDPQSPSQVPQNLSSGNGDVSSISAVPEYDQNKQEASVAEESPQFSVVPTAPTYSTFGLVPPMLGNQFAPFESSETQARDAPPLPSFVVQQPFDPSTGYYTQIYPPGGDTSGRFSPFLSPDTGTKYNGNLAILPSQAGQTSQESANSIVLPTTGPTPVVTQPVGVMQTSLAVTQQPVPVFRQPAGVHISHYPPNYIPYQYFSPFYVPPPPTIQHFLSNGAFLQQPLAGSIYPPPTAPTTTPVKNSLSQYKTGTNTGNSTHSGMLTGYGPYGSTPTGYSPSPAVTSGNSTGNEDITGPQYKENDVYITGQQSEGSAVWVPASGRDIPSMQTSSLYNLPPQGQHMTFTPLQAGHSAFNGIYHPTQSVAAASVHPLLQPSQTMAGAAEMVGRPSGVYQQPQRAQINWASNY